MTKHVLRTIRKKRRLWKTYTTTDDYRDFAAYKAFEKETTKAVKNAKRKFERKLAKDAKKNPKEFYSYMKSKTSNRESVGPLKADSKDTEFVTSDADMAEMLNEFFILVLFSLMKTSPMFQHLNKSITAILRYTMLKSL